VIRRLASRPERRRAEALALALAKQNGCTCDPDVDTKATALGHVVDVHHDDTCPLLAAQTPGALPGWGPIGA
jgi:hypothetical protein